MRAEGQGGEEKGNQRLKCLWAPSEAHISVRLKRNSMGRRKKCLLPASEVLMLMTDNQQDDCFISGNEIYQCTRHSRHNNGIIILTAIIYCVFSLPKLQAKSSAFLALSDPRDDILVIYCFITNYPHTQQLKTIDIYYLTKFMWVKNLRMVGLEDSHLCAWQNSAGCWQEVSVPCHLGCLRLGLLECPHNMAAGRTNFMCKTQCKMKMQSPQFKSYS